jgi:hypothetical protein
MKKPSSLRDDVLGWLTSSEADETADYARRGRLHSALTNEELLGEWAASFRRMAADIRNLQARAVTSDLQHEFALRSIKPPYDLVRDEIEAFTAQSAAMLEEIKAEDPMRYEQIENDIQRDLDTFKKARDDSAS